MILTVRESLYAISHSEKPINQKIDQSINHLSTVQYISWIPRAALNVTGGSQLLIQRKLRYFSSLITILYRARSDWKFKIKGLWKIQQCSRVCGEVFLTNKLKPCIYICMRILFYTLSAWHWFYGRPSNVCQFYD